MLVTRSFAPRSQGAPKNRRVEFVIQGLPQSMIGYGCDAERYPDPNDATPLLNGGAGDTK